MENQGSRKENKDGFTALFQYATIGIIVINRNGKIKLVNPYAEKLMGYQNAELVGQPLEVLIPEHLKQKHETDREHYFEKPKARTMGKGMELYARKKNGEVLPVDLSLGHYELEGEMLAVAFVTDNTERKQALKNISKLNADLSDQTRELKHSLGREKELNEIKSRFVSLASHEFRTPLTIIKSSISLLEKYTEAGQENKRKIHFDKVKSAVKNLNGILEDFLSLEQLELGKINQVIEPVDLSKLSEKYIGLLEETLKLGQIINCSHKGDCQVLSNRKIIGNIMSNLLTNAIKYSHEKGTIFLSTEVNENYIRLSVKDTGIGIPEEDQKDLFKMFHRGKNVNEIPGTGLGLNIVKRYVDLLDGTITFSSKINEGTTFKIEFPKVMS